jgi:hypothetical protein
MGEILTGLTLAAGIVGGACLAELAYRVLAAGCRALVAAGKL